jgi:nucleoside-diphosphate-sugar epimerase
MRVFVTGATGFVGSAVVAELINAGHTVLGLARSEQSAAKLRSAGADVHLGSLNDLESLRRGAGSADAVIHTGFNHDFTRFGEACIEDGLAIEAMGEALVGSGGKLIVTSGTAGLANGRLATEEDAAPQVSEHYPRRSEAAAAEVGKRGVPVSVVRLPPSVHGDGDHGFISFLVNFARAKGVSAYVGDGANQWPASHRADVARLFRLVLEQSEHTGPFHAIAEEGVPVRAFAEKVGEHLSLPVSSITPEQAEAHFEWFAFFVGANMAASSERTRRQLGWKPTGPGVVADLDLPSYYQG